MPNERYRVLAAEDDPQLREMLVEALADEGFDACAVENGAAALLAYGATGPYDALLLDDKMPHLSGRELLRELRAAGDDVPVLLISGHCELGEEEHAALRPAAVLRKPSRLVDICRALRAAIAEYRSR